MNYYILLLALRDREIAYITIDIGSDSGTCKVRSGVVEVFHIGGCEVKVYFGEESIRVFSLEYIMLEVPLNEKRRFHVALIEDLNIHV